MADHDDAPVPRAWHFPVPSTAELSRRLQAAGEDATLTVLPYVRDGLMFLHLRIVPAAESAAALESRPEPDINESHPCPPFTDCGGGG